ncbi:MAG: hypothetical protein H7A55_21335 [Verrucomicrobiaceae bacterium]|nr:hypothetical protein [Verrucomicrobiaceae bacterium]
MFTLHLAITWMTVGLIWVIQIIVYPQFRRVGEAEFRNYHFAHCLRIGLMIAPLMLLEMGSAAWLYFQGLNSLPFVISLAMFPVIILSTAILQAPLHTKLMQGRDDAAIQKLVRTNWLRTIAWSARGILLCYVNG